MDDAAHPNTAFLGVNASGELVGASVSNGIATGLTATFAPPAISGTMADQQTTGTDPIAGGATLTDPNDGTETLTISLSGGGGTLSGTGLIANADGTYTLTGSAADVTGRLEAVRFTPTGAGAPGSSNTTRFTLSDTTSLGTEASDSATTVVDTIPAAPTPVPTPTPPPSPTPDAVSLSSQVSYHDGAFTLAGTASSAAGVRGVEISAVVDGARQDLGAAAVNADGTFSFEDLTGGRQTFFVATLTDGAGGQAASADPGFNLTRGLGPNRQNGRQESFGATGLASTALFRPDGSRVLSVEAPGQTVDLRPGDLVSGRHQGGTTFVFHAANGFDLIGGFKLGGADHDTLALPSSEFANFAAVLRDTADGDGGALVTDPNTGDAIRLAGVTKAELKAHPKDFSFV